ncbi:DUF5801 domain-containing protein [Rhizobium sp. T136]|uniref:T1SS-143 repeat domain-containing protein n=1 Tax=Rhizobium sp. T136 TaxID=555319 RepID=UPI001E64E93D|nr:DUF5801 repeats-in-toxin domain-containing protein [Rhizobium sp. T136]UFS81470.1 DUF5801 domain-containing protein [Rhizobium sp. T136]
MSIEDPRISATSSENVSHDFRQDIHEDASIEASAQPGVEVAQADNSQQPEKTDRVPAAPQAVAANAHPGEIVPDQNNIAHLPADVSIDDIRVEGNNLVLVQADGTEIVIVNGALHVPTFLLGEVELPQQAVIAALEQNNINVAAGPDGSYSASASAPSSGADFQDTIQQDAGDPTQLAQLLADTQQPDPGLGDGQELFDDLPTISDTTTLSLTEIEGQEGGFETQSVNGAFGFNGGADVGQITAVQFVDSLNIDEGTQNGSHLDLTSDGKPVVITVDGLTITGSVDGQSVFVLTVTNAATGAFTFTQFGPLDHPDKGQAGIDDILRLQFSYTVTDKDGDQATGVASIDINDDGPSTSSVVDSSSIDESDLLSGEGGNAKVEDVSLGIHWGADAGTNRNLTFASVQDQLSGLKSDGQTVHFEISADGHTLTGFTGEGEGRTEVFVVTLDPTAPNGAYSFTLLQPLDHLHEQGSEGGEGEIKPLAVDMQDTQIDLSFKVTAKDADGDTVQTGFTVTVNDDVPVAGENSDVKLDDDALLGGNAGGQGDDADVQNVTGTLNHSYGADGAGSVLLTGAGLGTTPGAEGSFSQSVSADGKTLVISQVQHGVSAAVLTVTLSDTASGQYMVTQNHAIQHAAGNNENNQSFTIGYQATDGDGDTANGSITINVDDDTISWTASGSGSVNEDDLWFGNDLSRESTTATGSLNISWGADNYDVAGRNDGAGRSLVFAATGTVSAVDGLNQAVALTSNGEALSYTLSDNGTKLVATAHGETIFTVTVNDDGSGSYRFDLQGNLDQKLSGEDALKLTFQAVATDSDGDAKTVNFAVSVTDDVPVAIGQLLPHYVEEEELSGGNEDHSPNSDLDTSIFGFPVDVTTKSTSGSLLISWGSDHANSAVNGGFGGVQVLGDRSVSFAGASGDLTSAQVDAILSIKSGNQTIAASDLTSGGQHLTYTLSANGTVLTAHAGDETVFTATLTDTGAGGYSFDLSGVLDHPVKASGAQNEDVISLNFTATVRDGDGDQTTAGFTVGVIDDSPIVGNNATVKLDDDALLGGNAGGQGDDADAQNVTGTLNHSYGADGAGSVLLTGAGLGTTPGAEGSFSQSVSADGKTLVISQVQHGVSAAVLTVTLSDTASGQYMVTQNHAIQHAARNNENNQSFTIGYQATDGDGDTANGSITINVDDDTPTAGFSGTSVVTENGTNGVFATQSATGTLVFNGGADGATVTDLSFRTSIDMDHSNSYPPLSSHGVALTYATTAANGVITLTASAGGTVVFTLSANQSTGAYEFKQFGSIDHPANSDDLRLVFDFAATDGDGDKTAWNTGTVQVDIRDDVPTASYSGRITVQEAANADGSFQEASVTDTMKFDGGADGAKVTSIAYGLGSTAHPLIADADAAQYTAHALQSGGKDIHIEQPDGLTLLGKLADGTVIFKIEVTDAATGAYKFTQLGPIDQPDANETGAADGGRMKIVFTVTDGDGDTATNSLQIDINDDGPKASFSNTVTVTEAGTDAGIFAQQSVNGTLLFDGGADTAAVTNVNYRFGSSIMEMPENQSESIRFPALTSNGQPITVTTSVDGLTVTGKVGNVEVFTLHVTDAKTGAYTFTQSGPIDHPDKGQAGADDSLRMVFDFTVTDKDGDTATNAVQLDIRDDAPTAGYAGRVTVQETANANGSFHEVSGTGTMSFHAGADGAKITSIAYGFGQSGSHEVISDADAPTFTTHALQSAGQDIRIESANGGLTLLGKVGDTVIFKVEVTNPATGAYTFTQYRPIDNPDVNESGANDGARMKIVFTVTDNDGDTATGSVQIDINDDKPVIAAAADFGHLSETGLPSVSSDFGSLHVNVGADNKSAHVEIGRGVDGQPIINNGLTSDGVALEYLVRTTNGVDQEIVAFKHGDSADNPVFIVSVLHPGSFATTLFQNLDHAAGNDPLVLNLVARVFDGDGDYVDQPFSVNVADSVPTITGSLQPANLLANGSFEDGVWAHPESWGAWATESTGWKIEGTAPNQQGVQLERVIDDYLGMQATRGSPMVDLGASPGNIAISQNITGLIAGDSYKLTFEAGSPDAASSKLEVYWNSQLVGTIQPTGSMAQQTLNLTAGNGINTLTFKEVGNANDNTGTYLANVSLTHGSDVPVFHATTGEDSGVISFHLAQGTDFSFGADEKGTVSFDTAHVTIATPNGTTITLPPESYHYDAATGIFTINPGWGFNGLSEGEVATLTVPFKVTDGDGDSQLAVYQVAITGTNDAPVVSSAVTGTATEDGAGVTLDALAHASDVDASTTLAVTGVPGTLPAGVIYDAATHSFTLDPSHSAYQSLASGQTTTVTVNYSVSDGMASTPTSVSWTVTGTNDAAVVDLNGSGAGNDATTTAVEQLGQQFAWQATLGDVDSSTLQSMTLTLAHNLDGATESLTLNAAATAAANGLTVSYVNGVLSISGTASIATYQTILKNVVYTNSSDNPDASIDRTVTVVVNDGHDNSAAQVATIHIQPLNDAPVLAGTLAASVVEGQTHTLTAAELGYADPDDIASGVVFQVSNLSHGVITNGGASAASFTAAELNAGLIKFTHDGSEGPSASFQVKVEDGNEDNSAPVTGTFNFTVTPVNDGAATISISDTTQTASAPKVGDVLQATLGADPDGAQSNIVYHWLRDGVDTGASGATYTLVAADAGHAISVKTTYIDGQNVNETVTSAVTAAVVTANSAPSGANATIGLIEDNTYTFKAADFGYSDADGDAFGGVTVNAPASAGPGKLMLGDVAVTSATFVTAAQIASGMLTWAPADNVVGANGTTSFTFQVRDSAGNNDLTANTLTLSMSGSNYADVTYDDDDADLGVGPGYGSISIQQTDSGNQSIKFETASSTVFADLEFVRSDNNLEITLAANGATRTVTAINQFSGGISTWEQVDFDGGSFAGYGLGDSAYSLATGLVGGNGNSRYIIAGSAASESMSGGNGNDLLFGNGGDDTLHGDSGDDLLVGGLGRDTLYGDQGNDTLVGDQSDLLLDGGANTDTVAVGANFTSTSDAQIANIENVILTSAATLDLSNQTEDFKITGSSSADIITGGAGDDTLTGNGGNDTFHVAAGTDTITDLGGNDVLTVGAGATASTTATGNWTATSASSNVGTASINANGHDVSVANASGSNGWALTNSDDDAVILTGSSNADKITSGTAGDTINAGAGADTVTINASSASRTWTVDLGSDSAKDKIVFNHSSLSSSHNTVAIVSHFDVLNDKIAVNLNNSSLTDGGFQSLTSDGTAIASARIIEVAINSGDRVTLSLADDGNGDAIEDIIAAATNNIAVGTYTFIIYSSTNTSTANAGIYTVSITDGTNPDSGGMTVKHIMTLNGVGFGKLTSENFANAIDPIILDLDHNGVALTSLDNGVQFDINADGHKDQIAWTAGSDGILALDVDGNGKIDNGSEIFSPHFAGGSYVDGLAALATLDSNHDGKIDAADEAFSKLTVWQDLNHNGITDSGELSSLADHSITSISLDANASNSEISGQSILADGDYTLTGGSTGHFVEVAFDTTLGGSENGSNAYSLIGSDGDDILSGSGGMFTLSGGAGADTFVLDADALNDVKLADVITDFKASEGDTLDVSKLLDSLLGHEASEAEALASVKTTVSGTDTVVSVNANGGWHDVAVLQNTTEAVKILFDDKHDTTTAPHVG